jgi:hypothetical protein
MEVHFSNHYYLLLADSPAMKSKVAVAVIKVQTKEGPKNLEAMVDTGGAPSASLANISSVAFNPPRSEATRNAEW